MPLNPGTRVGPYEIFAPIGAGGMGEVYRAHDTRLGRDVALKILPTEVAADPSRRSRFEQEARAVAALNHPNIVAVYDVGDGYMVSELVDGETLRSAKFGLRKTLDIAAQIASGLAAAHAAGIVHRDLKPDNVLITKDGRAKILDFGLARIRNSQSSAAEETMTVRTEPGVVMGTAGYMSPEQVRGLEADHRSDIFSFGVMLHEMLSGQRAFQRETAAQTMTAILQDEAPDLPRSVPGGVREVVLHCLEKNPANRFQSALRSRVRAARSIARRQPERDSNGASCFWFDRDSSDCFLSSAPWMVVDGNAAVVRRGSNLRSYSLVVGRAAGHAMVRSAPGRPGNGVRPALFARRPSIGISSHGRRGYTGGGHETRVGQLERADTAARPGIGGLSVLVVRWRHDLFQLARSSCS